MQKRGVNAITQNYAPLDGVMIAKLIKFPVAALPLFAFKLDDRDPILIKFPTNLRTKSINQSEGKQVEILSDNLCSIR